MTTDYKVFRHNIINLINIYHSECVHDENAKAVKRMINALNELTSNLKFTYEDLTNKNLNEVQKDVPICGGTDFNRIMNTGEFFENLGIGSNAGCVKDTQ